MPERLRAVVVGAGWAGEGHTKALQWCGVHVAAICARQPEVVRVVADRLGVPEASIDWRATIERIKPDIVAVATPGSLRVPVVEAAVDVGAHILCDKPLAVTGEEAARLHRLVADAGVKHVYAATQRYGPSTQWLAELVRDGAIGTLIARGVFDYEVSRITASGDTPEPLPVPQRLLNALPRVGDQVLNKWCALARDFVADIRGEVHEPYLTFRDGWRYQVAVDAIRTGAGWTELPA